MDQETQRVLKAVEAHFASGGGSALGRNSPELAAFWPTVERLISRGYLETIPPIEEVPGRMVTGLTDRGARALAGG